MASILDRLKHAWNAFAGDPTQNVREPSYYARPDRFHLRFGYDRTMVSSIYNRIAIDCSSIEIKHVKLDENDRFVSVVDSYLNQCLALEANVDQTGRALMQDLFMSLFDEGCVALVPTKATANPVINNTFDVLSLRVAKIVSWFPSYVTVSVYNEEKGRKEEITLPKKMVAIIENPLYAVMNEPNSTLQRLIRKLNLLDTVDEQLSSAKLDIIIQLPYVIKSKQRREQAEERRKDIEMQLVHSKYGIAYTDGTERVIQLNRPAENNLMNEIDYLTKLLFNQLGLTESVFNGTATESEMLNYYNRTVEPCLSAVTIEMKRKFLTPIARSKGQSIEFFRDPFSLVPVNSIAEIADKFTRNEILSSNELRAIIGYKPVNDPRADELRNKNLNQNNEEAAQPPVSTEEGEEGYDDTASVQNEHGWLLRKQ